jgi:hypothetical protein
MPKKWEQMTKNQKLDMLRAEVANVMRRLDDVERTRSKKMKPKVKKASEKTVAPAPDPSDQRAPE